MSYLSLFYIIVVYQLVRGQSDIYLNEYLVHYWPLDHSDMSDIVGKANMVQGANTMFTTDRFGNLNSALSLNGGYTNVPPGYFFDTDQYTIAVWVYPDQLGSWSRVLDFANGGLMDNIILTLTSNSLAVPVFGICNSTTNLFELNSATPLINKKWQFLTATFNFNSLTANMYIDGVFCGNYSTNYRPPHKLRSSNFIGKSNYLADGYSNSFLDDIRFYNISLNQSQVVELMTSQTYSKPLC